MERKQSGAEAEGEQSEALEEQSEAGREQSEALEEQSKVGCWEKIGREIGSRSRELGPAGTLNGILLNDALSHACRHACGPMHVALEEAASRRWTWAKHGGVLWELELGGGREQLGKGLWPEMELGPSRAVGAEADGVGTEAMSESSLLEPRKAKMKLRATVWEDRLRQSRGRRQSGPRLTELGPRPRRSWARWSHGRLEMKLGATVWEDRRGLRQSRGRQQSGPRPMELGPRPRRSRARWSHGWPEMKPEATI